MVLCKRKWSVRFIVLLVVALFVLTPTSVYAASDEAIYAADSLYELGLFNGTGTDENGNPIYELDRQPTRHEAVTMLVRLLGKEDEAKSGSWNIPFTDVTEWAKPYVGYAYTNNLTFGTSETTFSGNDAVTASQYITLVLRALRYSSDTDFKWNASWEMSDWLGITNGEYNAGNNTSFNRGDVAIISNNALKTVVKDTSTKLLDTLNQEKSVNAEILNQDDDYKNSGEHRNKIESSNRAIIINRYRADFYEDNGLYYDEAELFHGAIEVEYNGDKNLYISSGDLYTLIIMATDLYTTKTLRGDNPFLDGAINQYNMISEYEEDNKKVWDFGNFKYLHWNEYITASDKVSWVEYRYNGKSCVLAVETNEPENQIYEQDGLRCVSTNNIVYVCVSDVLERLAITGEPSFREVDNIGDVWTFIK